MTGILLSATAATWLVAAYWLAKLLTRIFPTGQWRVLIGAVLFLVLVPLPLIDEIVGRRQFEKLCQERATIQVDRATVRGKKVYLVDLPRSDIKGTWVRVIVQPWRFVDAQSGDVVISYDILQAEGGRLVRSLGISESAAPLTFKGGCGPGGQVNAVKLLEELGVTQVQRSQLGVKESK